MHTITVISGGLLLLGAFALASRLGKFSLSSAALWFIPVWLLASIYNLYIGVSTAGYTVLQELPILIPVFGIPAAVAFYVSRRFSTARAG